MMAKSSVERQRRYLAKLREKAALYDALCADGRASYDGAKSDDLAALREEMRAFCADDRLFVHYLYRISEGLGVLKEEAPLPDDVEDDKLQAIGERWFDIVEAFEKAIVGPYLDDVRTEAIRKGLGRYSVAELKEKAGRYGAEPAPKTAKTAAAKREHYVERLAPLIFQAEWK